jgi:hypothetical protein
LTSFDVLQAGAVLIAADYTIGIVLGVAAVIAAGSFSIIARYLFDHGLADRSALAPNIIDLYKTYIAHTKQNTGRIGIAFWVHSVSAGIFIATGVIYTIGRLILPHFF